MLERKNIDRVFQENLKDLEIDPNKRVWNHIEQRLQGQAEKPSFAMWKKLGGVAAMLVAILTAGILYFQESEQTISSPVMGNTDNQKLEQPAEIQPDPAAIKPTVELADNKKRPRKSGKTIFVKKPVNKVIVTDNDIATIYSAIENKYVVDKDVFKEKLDPEYSITARMESIPEKNKPERNPDKKWSVGPTVAPVFYNSLQSGSPINESLAGNSKSSDNSMSFGVKVNYQVSNKFFIQSGLNKVELAYNTKDVNALISSSKNAIGNTNTNKAGVILTPVGVGRGNDSGSELNKSSLSGRLNQSLEYYELPIEMKYNLYDKRIGLNLVGGFSTLILSNNSLSIVSQDNVTDLGNANNLNNFNFSGNVGVDLDYKLTKSWYLNVAPMFKYQFNTYSGNSGNFRPYYFGLYSGLNYKF